MLLIKDLFYGGKTSFKTNSKAVKEFIVDKNPNIVNISESDYALKIKDICDRIDSENIDT